MEKSGHQFDDCFAIRCDLTFNVQDLRMKVLVAVPPPLLRCHLGELLNNIRQLTFSSRSAARNLPCTGVSWRCGRRCLERSSSLHLRAQQEGHPR
ncbi:hypothetical protein E2562_035623 [Oryza meyeriana var. granulata]|uniref:Uncharacterized protein n=1 Tax=Oryza meyeriana var. granulata TaxID=110450 RepID=A0A6G1C9J6_9ORYZ|nr:hypothetical protein E2562_035623 [Oryza meyeriana var. granulata]